MSEIYNTTLRILSISGGREKEGPLDHRTRLRNSKKKKCPSKRHPPKKTKKMGTRWDSLAYSRLSPVDNCTSLRTNMERSCNFTFRCWAERRWRITANTWSRTTKREDFAEMKRQNREATGTNIVEAFYIYLIIPLCSIIIRANVENK